MITYVDDHNRETRTERLLKVTLMNGKQGVAIIGHQSCINSFDFEENELGLTSIGGVLDLRGDIPTAIEAYNANQREWSSYEGRLIASYEELSPIR